MYELFAPTPRVLTYDTNRVKVIATEEGMVDVIHVTTVEEMELLHEQIMGRPILLRVWAEYIPNNYVGTAALYSAPHFENDVALLVDTSHPMIFPEFERGLEWAKKKIQSGENYCLELDFSPSIDRWLKANYPQSCLAVKSPRNHQAQLYITNYDRPTHCFDCNALWCSILAPCWLVTAPFYKLYRRLKCIDIIVRINTSVHRRTTLPNGKIVEVAK